MLAANIRYLFHLTPTASQRGRQRHRRRRKFAFFVTHKKSPLVKVVENSLRIARADAVYNKCWSLSGSLQIFGGGGVLMLLYFILLCDMCVALHLGKCSLYTHLQIYFKKKNVHVGIAFPKVAISIRRLSLSYIYC